MGRNSYLLLALSFLLSNSLIYGQVNYVLNPSLEQYDTCPNNGDQIRFAFRWSSIDTPLHYINATDGEPEYCNTCAVSNNSCGVPISAYYYHYPRTGNGMANIETFYDENYAGETYWRDYLQGKLYKYLTNGKNYCVTFYVTLTQGSQYANNKMGAYLDDGHIDTTVVPGKPQTEYMPQVVDTSIINDTLNWVKIEGSFMANGTEKFITIGNFFSKANTSYVTSISGSFSTGFTWYLVDDISVIESDHVAFAGNDTSIYKGDSILLGEIAVPYTWYKDSAGLRLIDSTSGGIWVKPDTNTTYIVKQTLCGVSTWDTVVVSVMPVNVVNVQNGIRDFRMYPNPNSGSFTVNGTLHNSKEAVIEIFNPLGQKVYAQTALLQSNKLDQQLNLHLSPGVYTLQIRDDNNRACISRLLIY